MPRSLASAVLISLLASSVSADTGLEHGDDLHSFYTRPDLKPPKWNITYHDRSALAPGYWFVSPYNFKENVLHDIKWQSCQCGPTIYDNDGELVWSGACRFPNRIMFDFKVSEVDDEEGVALTGIMEHADIPEPDVGAGLFLGSNYTVKHAVKIQQDSLKIDMHDFNTLESGAKALISLTGRLIWSGEEIGILEDIHVKRNGFREIDTQTGEILFEWIANDHLSLAESTYAVSEKAFGTGFNRWDPYHLNSVDKNDAGDYLISMRHTDSILLIDGKNGHIKWRLGGVKNDFKMIDDFKFSRQHNARFQSTSPSKTIISLMDNAYSGHPGRAPPTNPFSRALIVQINHPRGKPSTAQILKHYDRPDGSWNVKRGSVQILPNSNVFVTWTDGGYITEFADDGTPLMEAKWYNHDRFGTYRGYKFDNWVGQPQDHPKVVAIAQGAEDIFLTTLYVSWNGATEVAMWDFYNHDSNELLGRVNRTGFETAFVTQGRTHRVRAEALDRDGIVLGQSEVTKTTTPEGWKADAARHPYLEDAENTWEWRRYYDAAKYYRWYVVLVVLNLLLAGLLLTRTLARRRSWRSITASLSPSLYSPLPSKEEEEEEL